MEGDIGRDGVTAATGERERENFICHNIAKIKKNNTNGEYVAGCQKRLKAHRAGDQKRKKKFKNTNIR